MILNLVRKLFTANVMGVLLVILAMRLLTYGISASLRDTDTTYLFPVCLMAALVGLGLSKAKLNGAQASVLIAALGFISVWIMGAGLISPLVDLLKKITLIIPQLNPALRSPIVIDTNAIAEAWTVVLQASSALAARLQTWLFGFNRNVIVNDALVRNLLWILIMWLFSAWTGWFAGRRNAIAALLPSVLLLAMVTSYSERKVETLWLAVFILLLLMGIWNYKNHTQQWEKQKVDYSESIRYDTGQAVFFFTVVVGLFAFITPSVSWREIRDFLRERNRSTQSEAAEMLGIQEQPVSSQNSFVAKPSLPRDHLLTGGYAQSQKIVMTVRTGELPPITNPSLMRDVPRYYWRSVTYDIYMGAGWVTSSAPPKDYPANTPLIPGILDGHRPLHLDVQMVQPEGKLFWSGILFSADIPFTADWRVRPQSSLFADQSALLQADMFAATSNANSYVAQSYVPNVTEEQLRAASTEYPEYIRERYLALPRSVPERVHQLAQEIVAGKTTAFDKAKAIESYLRTYPYDLEVPAPPEEQDVADFFLFDLKKGYCDYYATAMVVLARSSGIPARFVSGYSPGSYDAPNAQYVVRELNAHSWAEIYFPEIGWVEFEPTGSQPEIVRLAENVTIPIEADEQSTATALLNRYRTELILLWLSPVIGIFLITLLYFTIIERWYYMRLLPAAAIERIFRRLYRLGRPLAGEGLRAETAYEFSNKLMNKMDETVYRGRFAKIFAATKNDIDQLTNMYYASLFSQHQTQKKDTIRAFKTWKQLRLRLMIARLMSLRARALRQAQDKLASGEAISKLK